MSWSGIPYAIEAILGERKKRDEIRDKAMKKLRASTTGDRTMTEADKAAHAATIEGILKAHEAFKQEVSDAVEYCRACSDPEAWTRIKFELDRFIIAKPDPLVEAFDAVWPGIDKAMVEALRAAIEKRGLKIVEDV